MKEVPASIPVNLPVVKPPVDDEIAPQNRNKIIEEIQEEHRKKNPDTITAEVVEKEARAVLQEVYGDASKNMKVTVTSQLQKDFTEKAKNVIKQKVNEEDVPELDVEGLINALREESEGIVPNQEDHNKASKIVKDAFENASPPFSIKGLEETKVMMRTFREKVANYPKYISYDGSVVLCSLLGIGDGKASVHITNLPLADQQVIKASLPDKISKELDYFKVKFDDNKDFIVIVGHECIHTNDGSKDESIKFNLFNSVVHPRPEDIRDNVGTVPVENVDGDKIAVGGKIVMNKKNIHKLMGISPTSNDTKLSNTEEEEYSPKRQPVAGRNAYEIRADVLQMSIDWCERNPSKYSTPEDVIKLAKQFYSFVENKRY